VAQHPWAAAAYIVAFNFQQHGNYLQARKWFKEVLHVAPGKAFAVCTHTKNLLVLCGVYSKLLRCGRKNKFRKNKNTASELDISYCFPPIQNISSSDIRPAPCRTGRMLTYADVC